MPWLWETPAGKGHIHQCHSQDLIVLQWLWFRGKPREEEEGEISEGCKHWHRQRHRAAVSYPNRQLVTGGWTGTCCFSVAPSQCYCNIEGTSFPLSPGKRGAGSFLGS